MDRAIFVKSYVRAPWVGPNRLGLIDRFFCRKIASNWDKEIEIELDGKKYVTTVGNEVTNEILMQAVAAGVLPSSVMVAEVQPTIDWEKLIDFISKLLPLIIEFIKALVLIFGL